MEIETQSNPASKRLNNAVAITVVILSVFMALSKIKDDNIVQAMAQAKSDAADTWNQYQAARIKQQIVETQGLVMRSTATGPSQFAEEIKKGDELVAAYKEHVKKLYEKAKSLEKEVVSLNYRDDQFDLSDALLAIALSLAAVAALTELWWLLFVSWGTGSAGLAMGIAGFAELPWHPDWIIKLLT